MTEERFDLRRLPVWERAAAVDERVLELSAGASFNFLTEVDPRALIGRLEQLHPAQLAFHAWNLGDAEWQVTVSRLQSDPEASSLQSAIKRSAVFGLLAPELQALLLRGASEHTARKGETIQAENTETNAVGLVLEGSFAVFIGAGARERLLFQLFAPETFGEIEFFDHGLSMGRTVALSKTARYALIPDDLLNEIVQREPKISAALAAVASQRSRRIVNALAAQVSRPIISRVANALLTYAAPERDLHLALPPLPNMTQAQVAAAAGTVKEVAARAIAELERVGALRRERGHIRYLDRAKLLEMIESS